MWLLYYFFSLKNDVNVALKSNKQKLFSCDLEGHWRTYQDQEPDLDALVRGTDPWIRILIKISRIPNTASQPTLSFFKVHNNWYQYYADLEL
jgi:hypothetical protein